MHGELTLDQNVASLVAWAWSDSRVRLDPVELARHLQVDHDVTGRFMTEEECERLVCGDDDGAVPVELRLAFLNTHDFIASYW